MSDISIVNFLQFISTHCTLFFTQSDSITDSKRKTPRIPTKFIFYSLFLGLSTDIRSLLSLDKFLKKSLKSTKIIFKLVTKLSDSLIQKVMGFMDINILQQIHKYTVRTLNNMGYFKHPKTGMVVGIMDGSLLLKKFPASCFMIAGKSPILYDWERFDKKGKELNGSNKLLSRVLEELKDQLNVILFDGLYYSQSIMEECVREGTDFLIKTTEETIVIVREFEEILKYSVHCPYLMSKKGYDQERMLSYEVIGGLGGKTIKSNGNEKELYVYKVQLKLSQKRRKENYKETFFVITTIKNIDLIVELSLTRWAIENNLFKQLKSRHGLGKSLYVRKSHEAFDRFMYIVAISFNLVEAYITYEEESYENKEDKLTTKEIVTRLRDGLMLLLCLEEAEHIRKELNELKFIT